MRSTIIALARFGAGLSSLLFSLSSWAAGGVGLALWADAAGSTRSVRFEDKQLQLTTAALGARVSTKALLLGEVYAGVGAGYAPDRDATFIGRTLTGDASLTAFELGFQRVVPLPNSDSYRLAVEGRWLRQRLEGDFSGQIGDLQATAQMTSTMETADLELGVFRFSESSRLGFGIGLRDWDVEAQATGQLGESIRARTDAEFTGTSALFSMTAIFPVFKRAVTARYEWTEIPAQEKVGINRLTVRWRVR